MAHSVWTRRATLVVHDDHGGTIIERGNVGSLIDSAYGLLREGASVELRLQGREVVTGDLLVALATARARGLELNL